jgi:hypothetical protein
MRSAVKKRFLRRRDSEPYPTPNILLIKTLQPMCGGLGSPSVLFYTYKYKDLARLNPVSGSGTQARVVCSTSMAIKVVSRH